MNVVFGRVWIVRCDDSAVQRLHQLRYQRPMLRSEAVDVDAAVKVNDVLVAGILFRRDGPNQMPVDFAFRDLMYAM